MVDQGTEALGEARVGNELNVLGYPALAPISNIKSTLPPHELCCPRVFGHMGDSRVEDVGPDMDNRGSW